MKKTTVVKGMSFGLIAVCMVLISGLGSQSVRAASSWWHEAPLKIVAHDHRFYRVTANAIGCEVRVRLHFDAPQDRYRDPAASSNHYRFLAQLKMSGGDRFLSEVLSNRQAGPRVFSFTYDSQFDGCWAEQERRIRKVNIHSCRGKGCTPRGFK